MKFEDCGSHDASFKNVSTPVDKCSYEFGELCA
jgi:hypothetical protein